MLLRTSLPITESFKPEYLQYYGILPLDLRDGTLRVAASGTPSRDVLEDLEFTYDATPVLVPAEAEDIADSVEAIFSAAESTDALVKSLDTEASVPMSVESFEADARDLANQPPVVRYVNLLIREAHEARASDIHVEATPRGPAVRFRIDGILSPATAPPRDLQAAVVSRLKLVANLDIAERRAPQDGRIRIRFDHDELDLRVSTVPSLYGESIVLRLLDRGDAPEGLEPLGMPSQVHEHFAAAAGSAHGIVLATGPTGSGKTTTLYAALRGRNTAREKVITIEDPVEYELHGVTQVPVNERAGVTFAKGLRSILRQDPDVLMVGEMRDSETARIAVQAALTGHVVFSTVHTNDAAGAVVRLIDLGIEPYLLAATLRGVLAQRLVRRVCEHCAEDSDAGPSFYRLFPDSQVGRSLRRGVGCTVCRNTGFRGRTGLFEWLPVTDEIRSLIIRSPDVDSVRAQARADGMRSLADDGREKVLEQLTTPEEVLRAIQT